MRFITVFCLLLLATPALAQEKPAAGNDENDEVKVLIEKAGEAWKGGEAQAAIDLLQLAIQKIQQSGQKGIAACMPAVPEGWKAEPADSTSGMWGAGTESFQWSQVERIYKREKEPVRVTVTISSSPQLMMGPKQMLKMLESPQYRAMMNQNPDQKMDMIKKGTFGGFKTIEKGKSAQAVIFGEALMVIVAVPRPDEAMLDSFVNAVDFKTLATLDQKGKKQAP